MTAPNIPRFDREGKPIYSLEEWADLFQNLGYRTIAEDVVTETQSAIVTLWNGFDKYLREPPRIFETFTSRGGHSWSVETYTTEAEAIAGHQQRLELLRSQIPGSSKD